MPTEPQTAARPSAAAPPQPQREVWLDGAFVPAGEAAVSVFDHGVLYGDGVFEGIRSYNGRIFKLATHLKRLYDSAKSIRLDIPYSADELGDAVRQLVQRNGTLDGYIRLVVTRGAGSLGLNPFSSPNPVVFIIADTIKLYPQEMYDHGMHIITAATVANHPASLSPRVKSLNYLKNVLAKIEAIDAGAPEAIMLNAQGFVAECTSDNLFIVAPYHDKTSLLTPPLHASILEGVTRNVVIQLAHEVDLPVVQTDLTRHDLYVADEMFLTGTAAEVIAVTQVDGRKIGTGEPGPVTRRLIAAFRQLVADQAPED